MAKPNLGRRYVGSRSRLSRGPQPQENCRSNPRWIVCSGQICQSETGFYMQNAAIGRDIQTRFLLNHGSFLGTPVLVKAFRHRYGTDLAERIHTEQSTGAPCDDCSSNRFAGAGAVMRTRHYSLSALDPVASVGSAGCSPAAGWGRVLSRYSRTEEMNSSIWSCAKSSSQEWSAISPWLWHILPMIWLPRAR